MKEKYGFLPTSVWDIGRSKKWKRVLPRDPGDPRETTRRSANCKYLPSLPFSKYNPDVAERVVRYWSEVGDTVVDPFAGRTTRGAVCIYLGRNYVGYEVAPRTFDLLNRQLRQVPNPIDGIKGDFTVFLSDGCKLEYSEDNSADLIYTCPPYHNLERYESAPNQLSDIKHYGDFLKRIEECASNCYRVLKARHFLVWHCADWRKNKQLIDFSSDSIRIFTDAGFQLWDKVIYKLRSPFAWTQISKCDRMKYTSKSHEYLLVFKKV